MHGWAQETWSSVSPPPSQGSGGRPEGLGVRASRCLFGEGAPGGCAPHPKGTRRWLCSAGLRTNSALLPGRLRAEPCPPSPSNPPPSPPLRGCLLRSCLFLPPPHLLSEPKRKSSTSGPFSEIIYSSLLGGLRFTAVPPSHGSIPHIPHRGQRAPGRPHCVPWVSAQCTEGQVGAVGMPVAPSPPSQALCLSFPAAPLWGAGPLHSPQPDPTAPH